MILENPKININDRILVLGSSGLIGSACVKQLHKRGYKNILYPSRKELDLSKANAVAAFFDNNIADVVILAAGTVGGIADNIARPFNYISENLQIFLNVCGSANIHNVKRVVLLGSSCMYPLNTQQPMPVSALFSGGLEASSLPYAIAKLASISFGLSFNRQFKTSKYLALIPNSTYGPGDNFNADSGHVLSALLKKFHLAKKKNAPQVDLWGTGTPKREFVYSEDVADAIIFALENGVQTFDEPINIGVGHDVSIAELANTIKDIVGFTGNISWDTGKPDGASQKLLDSTPIKSLGWRPKIELKAGIKNTYEYYLSNQHKI